MARPSIASLRRLLEVTAASSRIPMVRLVGPERTRSAAYARFAFAWVAAEHLDASQSMIAAAVGRTDHTTIGHAVRRAAHLRLVDPDFRVLVDRLAASTVQRKD